MQKKYELLALCPAHTEDLVTKEIEEIGGEVVRAAKGRVEFSGDLSVIYKILLSTRVANRILLKIKEFEVTSPDDLYKQVLKIEWNKYFKSSNSILINSNVFDVRRIGFNNTGFAVLKVKDAICDFFRKRDGLRPDVDKDNPDIIIFFELLRNNAGVYIDLSGGSLHQRGYRQRAVAAPLKETLAAALLYRAGWDDMLKKGASFVDPFCGSGTIVIEAALMAYNIAPGLMRKNFGFEFWKDHNAKLFATIKDDFQKQIKYIDNIFIASDIDAQAIEITKNNLRLAELSDNISLFQIDATKLNQDFLEEKLAKEIPPGLILTNPPYGERLSDFTQALELYNNLGTALANNFEDWDFSLFTSNKELSMKIPFAPHKVNTLYNGKIECFLASFKIKAEQIRQPRDDEFVTPGMEMLINRLRKNLRQTRRWVNRNNINCFRCYDADLPEYSAFIEVYRTLENDTHLVVSEYAPPAEIPESQRSRRLSELLKCIEIVFKEENPKIHLRTRVRQKGRDQYERRNLKNQYYFVQESGLKFKVNFEDFLDVGIFLDHRPVRNMIKDFCKDIKDAGEKCFFLNLFAYTGSASVYAASEGAITVTVDKSRTYLNWAKDNMSENNFTDARHRYVQDDCFDYLNMTTDKFDLIFLDPPTFSNTRSKDKVFDIQNDHVRLIKAAASKLRDDGLLIFSNNFRRFEMGYQALEDLNIIDITDKTIDIDFQRNPKIHQCYFITRK